MAPEGAAGAGGQPTRPPEGVQFEMAGEEPGRPDRIRGDMYPGTSRMGYGPHPSGQSSDNRRKELVPLIFGTYTEAMTKEQREFFADVARETGHHRLRAELRGKEYKKGFGAKLSRGMNKKLRVRHVVYGTAAVAAGVVLIYEPVASKMNWKFRIGIWD